MISSPVWSARCTVRSKLCPPNGFRSSCAGCRAVEEAAELLLELVDHTRRVVDERPRELLVVAGTAALERVVEMRLGGVAVAEHRVETALHHARAA